MYTTNSIVCCLMENMFRRFFKFLYKYSYYNINKKTTNNVLLSCLFFNPKQYEKSIKIRSPPVLYLINKELILKNRSFLMDKKYYIFVNGEKKFEVNKEIYDVYYKGLEKERYFDSFKSESSTDSLIVSFKNLINDSYLRDISIKIRSSLDIKSKNGEFIGSFATYGYLKNINNRNKLVIDEIACKVVE